MQRFNFKGYDREGRSVAGQMDVADLDQLELRLQSQGISLVMAKGVPRSGLRFGASIREQSFVGQNPGSLMGGFAQLRASRRFAHPISDKLAASLLDSMATMISVGVPLVEVLDTILETSPEPPVQQGMRRLRDQIVSGSSLSDAILRTPGLFPDLVCDMVRVAEEGGQLDATLFAAAGYLERSANLKRKIADAMIYPGVMMSICLVTVLAIIIFVIPRFTEVFQKMHAKIPVTTRWMFIMGTFLRENPVFSSFTAALLIGGIIVFLRTETGRFAVSNVALRLPKIGDLLRSLAVARALRSTSTLLNSNVSMIEALKHGAQVCGNPQLKRGLLSCAVAVESGSTLAQAFADTKLFKPMLIRIVSIGEKTGKLGPMLAVHGEKLESDTNSQLQSLVKVLEPILIAGMGVFVGTVAVSIIVPIYSTIQNIH